MGEILLKKIIVFRAFINKLNVYIKLYFIKII